MPYRNLVDPWTNKTSVVDFVSVGPEGGKLADVAVYNIYAGKVTVYVVIFLLYFDSPLLLPSALQGMEGILLSCILHVYQVTRPLLQHHTMVGISTETILLDSC